MKLEKLITLTREDLREQFKNISSSNPTINTHMFVIDTKEVQSASIILFVDNDICIELKHRYKKYGSL